MQLLRKENILLDCQAQPKEDVIRAMGQLLLASGYIEEGYIDGMLAREEVFSTNIGNGIAIPHSVEEGKKYVRHSGIAVMVFPEGTTWNQEMVQLVIAIAGNGNDHLTILSNIAEKLCSIDAMEELVKSDKDTIYDLFISE